jgi:TPR repeat protein
MAIKMNVDIFRTTFSIFFTLIFLSACANKPGQDKGPVNAYTANQQVAHSYCFSYLYGDHLAPPEYSKAKIWCTRSATSGVAASQVLLAEMHLYGIEMRRDPDLAFTWYDFAAEQGHPPAQFMLSELYRRGLGVEKNIEKSKVWLLRSAANGHSEAQKISSEDKKKPVAKTE